ncbi:unnamed protein product [Caretta caretta]
MGYGQAAGGAALVLWSWSQRQAVPSCAPCTDPRLHAWPADISLCLCLQPAAAGSGCGMASVPAFLLPLVGVSCAGSGLLLAWGKAAAVQTPPDAGADRCPSLPTCAGGARAAGRE